MLGWEGLALAGAGVDEAAGPTELAEAGLGAVDIGLGSLDELGWEQGMGVVAGVATSVEETGEDGMAARVDEAGLTGFATGLGRNGGRGLAGKLGPVGRSGKISAIEGFAGGRLANGKTVSSKTTCLEI